MGQPPQFLVDQRHKADSLAGRLGPNPEVQSSAEVEEGDQAIPVNAKVYVAASSGLEKYLQEAIRKKKVPVVLVTDRKEAEFEMRGGYSGGGGHWTIGGDMIPVPVKDYDNVSGHLSIVSLRTGYRVWAETAEVAGGAVWPGGNVTSAQKRLANKLIGALKKKIEADLKMK